MKTLPTQSKFVIAAAVLTALFATGCERRSADENNGAATSSTAPADTTGTPSSTEMSPPATTPDSTTPPAASETPPATTSSTDNTMNNMESDAKMNTEKAKTAIDDTIITTKVKTALLADSDIKGLAIDVDTSGGVVSLTGEVANQTQIDRAGKLAADVKGVSSVNNKLTIKQ